MTDMRFAVMGAAGRMGRELARAIHQMDGCVLAGATEVPGSEALGQDAGVLAGIGPLGVELRSAVEDVVEGVDAVIDFTSPKATVELAGLTAKARIVHVIGTTGFAGAEEEAIKQAAQSATIIKSGNMSLGVNLLSEITRRVAAALDDDYDIEIVEMHHRHKVDAPSGTALMLGAAAASGRAIDLAGRSDRGRDGHTGARRRGDIGFASLRGGTVVGDHSVIFAGPGERIEIAHHAEDRGIFARGAVKAALWGRGKGPGLFTMSDVLGL
jgi:4-hydroxy-tetrahydrodipicolinate reductase